MSDLPPLSTKVLVIGGGPGGSYAASLLARENIDVVVLEAETFPRYHVGESQLASLKHFLRLIDLEDEFVAFGFHRKIGAAFKFNQHKREGYTNFIAKDPNNYSWNLLRSQSDELMLRHASKCGAKVFEATKVVSISFSDSDSAPRPVSATWKQKSGQTGEITFDYIIDASGRSGILSTKYLKNRKFNETLKNVASWGYFRGTSKYLPGTERENVPFFEALTDETGWSWFIPLHDGTTSVGVVQHQDALNAKKIARKIAGEDISSLAQFKSDIRLAPHIHDLIRDGELVMKDSDSDGGKLLRSASDYSYTANEYAGTGYRIVGDAACFIDPFFSSGCHLAIAGALSAVSTICAVMKGDCEEEDAVKWHTKRVETSYTRFLLVVLSAYHQMRSQNAPVLSNENEDNFDRAFDHFRPIIQGMSDSGIEKTEELEKSIEFLSRHTFASGIQSPSVEHPNFEPMVVDLHPGCGTVQSVRQEIEPKSVAQRRAVRELLKVDDQYIDGYISHVIHGYRLRAERGKLGLEKVGADGDGCEVSIRSESVMGG